MLISSAIADPNVALLLLVVGALGIYAEFSSPGMIAPGVAGSVLALLGLNSLSRLPLNWFGASLLLLALLCFVLEATRKTHGAFTAAGAACMLFGALRLVDAPRPELRIHFSTALGLTLPFAFITSFLLTVALRARRNKLSAGDRGSPA